MNASAAPALSVQRRDIAFAGPGEIPPAIQARGHVAGYAAS